MSGLDAVLERLLTDTTFRTALDDDPVSALAGYELTADDLEVLSAQVAEDRGDGSSMEARHSKAGLFGLLAAAAEIAGSAGDPAAAAAGPR